jgi:hypothetical protein
LWSRKANACIFPVFYRHYSHNHAARPNRQRLLVGNNTARVRLFGTVREAFKAKETAICFPVWAASLKRARKRQELKSRTPKGCASPFRAGDNARLTMATAEEPISQCATGLFFACI